MVCKHCGKELPEDATVCDACGAEVEKVVVETTGTTESTSQTATASVQPAPAYSMKWYNFLVYFALWASAVVNIYTAITYFTGSIYNTTETTAKLVYDTFPALKPLDIVYGVIVLLLAGLAIAAAIGLLKYRKFGPLCVILLYFINAGTGLIYAIIAAVIIGEMTTISTVIVSVVVALVVGVLNITYFKKRKELFK